MISLSFIPVLLVALGGALGSMLRYAAVQGVQHFQPQPFALGTLGVNVVGSFAIGLLMARYQLFDSESARLFLVTGLLGGFTTFSAFSWDVLQLLQRGQLAAAGMYVIGSVIFSLVAVAAGFHLGR